MHNHFVPSGDFNFLQNGQISMILYLDTFERHQSYEQIHNTVDWGQ